MPVTAAVDGAARDGGCELALAWDIREVGAIHATTHGTGGRALAPWVVRTR